MSKGIYRLKGGWFWLSARFFKIGAQESCGTRMDCIGYRLTRKVPALVALAENL